MGKINLNIVLSLSILFLFTSHAVSGQQINETLPTKENLIKMWEERILNDPETIIFEKTGESRYKFKTNKFSFESFKNELEIVGVDIKDIRKGCAIEYSIAVIYIKLSGIPEYSEFFDNDGSGIKREYWNNEQAQHYLNWHGDNCFFYYDYREKIWLSEREYNDKEGECKDQLPIEDRIKKFEEDVPEMKPFLYFIRHINSIALLILAISILWGLKNKFKNKNLDNSRTATSPKSKDNDNSTIEIREYSKELTIIIPQTNRTKNAYPNTTMIVWFIGMSLIILTVLLISLNSDVGPIYKFLEDIGSGKMPSFESEIGLFGVAFFCLFMMFLVFFQVYRLTGFNKIHISQINNTVAFSRVFPLRSLLPKFIYEKKTNIDKVSVIITEPIKILGTLIVKERDLYLFFKEDSFHKEEKINIADNHSVEEKERIYEALNRYI